MTKEATVDGITVRPRFHMESGPSFCFFRWVGIASHTEKGEITMNAFAPQFFFDDGSPPRKPFPASTDIPNDRNKSDPGYLRLLQEFSGLLPTAPAIVNPNPLPLGYWLHQGSIE
jgi:hypothetical protein